MTTAFASPLEGSSLTRGRCLDFENDFGTIERTACLEVHRELCPHSPAWLDAVNILLNQPVLVINPYRNHLAITYDGLPQGDPLSTLIFSITMTSNPWLEGVGLHLQCFLNCSHGIDGAGEAVLLRCWIPTLDLAQVGQLRLAHSHAFVKATGNARPVPWRGLAPRPDELNGTVRPVP